MDDLHINVGKQIEESEKILIGLGEECCVSKDEGNSGCSVLALEKLAEIIKGKDYYIVAMNPEGLEDIFDPSRIVGANDIIDSDVNSGKATEKFARYSKWLTFTINRKLTVIELQVGFENASIIRWPFESIVYYNNKATFVRVNNKIPNISLEIASKSLKFVQSVDEFVDGLIKNGDSNGK